MPDEAPKQQTSPLKQLRQRVGLTQAELARRIGVSDRAVRAWEKGEYPPTLTVPQMRSLCRELAITFDELPDEFGPSNSSQ
ncbi:XRE family transcriptional regulator [filamentous cyanobacterium CCT1]|nr:XRE family transcriptional regulator [filamentous cyanobacterium CCT1]PSN78579.1 XRE family transcriptional regulator [filamentous cyanobacterium CCP4]